jgi:hypothetical protein
MGQPFYYSIARIRARPVPTPVNIAQSAGPERFLSSTEGLKKAPIETVDISRQRGRARP